MPVNKNDTWFRIAGNSRAVKDKLPQRWRCFVGTEEEVYMMVDYSVSGAANKQNFITGFSNVEGVDPRLWFSVYGDVSIDDDEIGVFTLKDAPFSPPL